MLVDNLFNLPPILRRQVEAKGLLHVKIIPVEPILTFRATFTAMDMDRFVSFICVKEKPPAHYKQYGWHTGLNNFFGSAFIQNIPFFEKMFQIRAAVRDGVERVEAAMRDERARTGKRILGRRAVLD